MKANTKKLDGESYLAERKCERCGIRIAVEMDNNRIPRVECGSCGEMMDVVPEDDE